MDKLRVYGNADSGSHPLLDTQVIMGQALFRSLLQDNSPWSVPTAWHSPRASGIPMPLLPDETGSMLYFGMASFTPLEVASEQSTPISSLQCNSL